MLDGRHVTEFLVEPFVVVEADPGKPLMLSLLVAGEAATIDELTLEVATNASAIALTPLLSRTRLQSCSIVCRRRRVSPSAGTTTDASTSACDGILDTRRADRAKRSGLSVGDVPSVSAQRHGLAARDGEPD